MVPEAVFGMLACARIGAIHSVVFGGFASRELATRIDRRPAEGDPDGVLRHRGQPGRPYKPLLDEAIELADAKPRVLHRARSGPQAEATLTPGRDHDWARALAAARQTGGLRAGRARPIRSTSSTRPARPGCRRASCATTAATRSRCSWIDAQHLRRRAGRVYWAASDLGWVVGPLVHRLRAAAARLHDGALRGQAGRHAGRRARSGA